MYQYLLFDLDGTLTDPKEGICKSFCYALEGFGIQEKEENLLKVIGPPLIDSFQEFYGMSKDDGQKAVERYRERFSVKGWRENRVYEGIPELLEELHRQGKTLCLATCKPEVFAKKILDLFSLTKYFSVMVGAELDGTRNYKNEVIEEVLRQLGNPPKESVLMIGDRKQDIEGARACGIPCMGVRFGCAEEGELEGAGGADLYAETVEEMKILLTK
ncbi:MAG: HAD-IA family hydrolase [Clostridia bacterium]|nr:HAD-IA family hydrolase [Clostridia bacterium]